MSPRTDKRLCPYTQLSVSYASNRHDVSECEGATHCTEHHCSVKSAWEGWAGLSEGRPYSLLSFVVESVRRRPAEQTLPLRPTSGAGMGRNKGVVGEQDWRKRIKNWYREDMQRETSYTSVLSVDCLRSMHLLLANFCIDLSTACA